MYPAFSATSIIKSYPPSKEEVQSIVCSQSFCYTLQPGPHPSKQVRRPRGSSSLLPVSSPPSGLTGGGDKREQLGQDTCPHPVSLGLTGHHGVCTGESAERGRQLWGVEGRGSEAQRCDWEGLRQHSQKQPSLQVCPQPSIHIGSKG